MTTPVDIALRDLPVEGEKAADNRILYYLNRELVPVVRKIRSFVNSIEFVTTDWGNNVDVSEDYSVRPTDEYLRVDASNGNVTILLLPSAEAMAGVRVLNIKRLNSGGGSVIWLAQGDDDVDDAPTNTIYSQYESVRLRPRTSGYDIV